MWSEGVKTIRGTSSAPTARVLDVIELLTRAGESRLRFSDIVRELGLTQATGHAILKTLCDRGWVSRDPVDKTFAPGPALAVVAASTDLARPLTHAARAAALALSSELGYPASVVERVEDTLVMTAIEGGGPDHAAGIPGDRIPYAPPFGAAFAAWDTPEEQRTWADRVAATDPAVGRQLARLLARTRDRGFDIDRTTPVLAQHAHMVGTLRGDGLPQRVQEILELLLAEFTTIGLLCEDDPAREQQPVVSLSAPVFDHRHRVALLLCVHPLRTLPPGDIDMIGRRLTRATAAIRSPERGQ